MFAEGEPVSNGGELFGVVVFLVVFIGALLVALRWSRGRAPFVNAAIKGVLLGPFAFLPMFRRRKDADGEAPRRRSKSVEFSPTTRWEKKTQPTFRPAGTRAPDRQSSETPSPARSDAVDVFLSYARADAVRAEAVARALSAEGLRVWWDQRIPAGVQWEDYIPEKLHAAGAVVVLWSQQAVGSRYVREEARMAVALNRYVPARLDATPPPFGFTGYETVELGDWSGAGDHHEWRHLVEAVTRLRLS